MGGVMSREFEDIENNESEDDLEGSLKLSEAVLWATDWTTETILSQINRDNIVLNPRFQRRDAWSTKQKSMFIESLIMGLPIPQIILAESKEKRGQYIVIDGKQRLLSIRQFFSDTSDSIYKQFKLNGLTHLKELNKFSYSQLDLAKAEYSDALQNQSIRTVIIKNWPNEQFLYTVFLRLNTGSLQLSPQELRQALHPGPFLDYIDDFATNSHEIMSALNIIKPDYRMRDTELVIRYFSWKFFIDKYTGNLKDFFDNTIKILNKNWDVDNVNIKETANELNEAISFTFSIFGPKNSFSKWIDESYVPSFNRAIFDIMTFYFSDPIIRNNSESKRVEIENAFKDLCINDAEFLQSFETSTKNIRQVKKRFNTWAETLANVLSISIGKPINDE